MRLPDKLITELVKGIAGQDGVSLVMLIKDKQNVSELKISEKLDHTVNEVRNILYRLHEHNLVSFTRKKDKKKGWYIYFWTFDLPTARAIIIDQKRRKVEELKKQIKSATLEIFYTCPSKCITVNSENALELQFKCPECNQVLQQLNNQDLISKMNENVSRLSIELNEALSAIEVTPGAKVAKAEKDKLQKLKQKPQTQKQKPKSKPKQKQKPKLMKKLPQHIKEHKIKMQPHRKAVYPQKPVIPSKTVSLPKPVSPQKTVSPSKLGILKNKVKGLFRKKN